MTQFEFEGVLLEGLIYQCYNGYTISLRGNYHNAVPLMVGACLEGRAIITNGKRRFSVSDVSVRREAGVMLVANELTEDAL